MRLLGSTFASAIVVWIAVSVPLAQKAPPPPPKKSPLLKLAEPWPAAEVMEAARVEVDSRRLFKETEPLTFTLTADFKATKSGAIRSNRLRVCVTDRDCGTVDTGAPSARRSLSPSSAGGTKPGQ